MKKIVSLTKVFVKEYYQNLPIFDTTKNKFNKKSLFFWLVAIVFLGTAYVSYEIINFLKEIGQEDIFLNIYLPITLAFLAFESILSCANIFFFSEDVQKVLHMPIKEIDLLVAKLCTMLFMLYCSEALIAIVPLTLYGMLTSVSFIYYFWEVLYIIISPIFVGSLISLFVFIIMRALKFIRNKDTTQLLISVLLIVVMFLVEHVTVQEVFKVQSDEKALQEITNLSDRIVKVNKYFLIINPAIDMLTNATRIKSIISFIKISCYTAISTGLFLCIGKLTYIKDILRNIVSIEKNRKKINKRNINKRIKNKGIAKLYIEKEIKLLIRNPIFFMQCIFPVLIILITGVIIVFGIYPVFIQALQDEKVKQAIEGLSFNTEVVCDILIVMQVLFSISNISLTAISREGKSAVFVKYIPIELYQQFIYKNIPQFLLNLLITIVVLGMIWYMIPSIQIIYMIMIFCITTVINLINCYLMLIVDLRRPNLDWSTEDAVVKKSDNKLFQYATMIVNILFLFYIASILKRISIIIAMGVELIIYIIAFIIIDRCVKKWQNKLFSNII